MTHSRSRCLRWDQTEQYSGQQVACPGSGYFLQLSRTPVARVLPHVQVLLWEANITRQMLGQAGAHAACARIRVSSAQAGQVLVLGVATENAQPRAPALALRLPVLQPHSTPGCLHSQRTTHGTMESSCYLHAKLGSCSI